MRIAITGATGNVGTALVRALVADDSVDEIIGIARRLPDWQPSKVRWVQADVALDNLVSHFDGADAVVHLAWLIQPSRDEDITEEVNVHGSRRVFDAAAAAGVPALVYASSVGAYGPADHAGQLVDESWPTSGIPSSYYSRQKAAVETALDDFESVHSEMRIVRARPGLIFQRSAAAAIRRYFAGPFVPGWAARCEFIPLIPDLPGLVAQVVHSDDVADFYRRACLDPSARGAYNVATSPPLDADALGHLLEARPVSVPAKAVRTFVKATWHARLHPVSPGWLDLGRDSPLLLTDRARNELGWTPLHDAGDVVREFMDGLRDGAGFDTPPLAPHAGGFMRAREILTGVGGPNPLDRRSASHAKG